MSEQGAAWQDPQPWQSQIDKLSLRDALILYDKERTRLDDHADSCPRNECRFEHEGLDFLNRLRVHIDALAH